MLIEVLLMLTLGLSAFGQLQRFDVLGSNGAIYFFEFPLLVTLVLLIAKYRRKPFQGVFFSERAQSTKLLMLVMAVSLLFSIPFFSRQANINAVAYFLRLSMYILSMLYVHYYFAHAKRMGKWLMWSVIAFCVFVIVTGILQYVFYPDLRNLFYAGWDPHFYRLFGLYFEPVIAGSIYGVLVIFVVTNTRVQKYIRGLLALIFAGMLVATFSRAVWVGMAVVTALYASSYKLFKFVIVVAVVGIALFIALPKPSGEGVNILRVSTVISRGVDYQEGLAIWQRNPLLGIGYNHIGAVKQNLQTDPTIPNHAAASLHSSFLIILATGGIIGFFFFMNWLWMLSKSSPFLRYSILFLSVCSLFDNVLLHPFVLVLVVVLGGLSVKPQTKFEA